MKKFLQYFIIFMVGVALFVIASCLRSYKAEKNWNNGICSNCGGHYEFVNASTTKRDYTTYNYYFYKCDSCENTISVEKEMIKD